MYVNYNFELFQLYQLGTFVCWLLCLFMSILFILLFVWEMLRTQVELYTTRVGFQLWFILANKEL